MKTWKKSYNPKDPHDNNDYNDFGNNDCSCRLFWRTLTIKTMVTNFHGHHCDCKAIAKIPNVNIIMLIGSGHNEDSCY